jgi:predicted nucleic acid-binding protein
MNRGIICNTGPLIALALIDRMDVLQDLFEFVAIPEEVHEEILRGGLQKAGLANYEKVAWIKVLKLSKPSDALLTTSRGFRLNAT